MAEIVAAALTAHAPLITGKPDVSRPEQRDRLYAGFHELRRRLAKVFAERGIAPPTGRLIVTLDNSQSPIPNSQDAS